MSEKGNNQGHGRIQGYEAFKKASEEQPPEPPTPPEPPEHDKTKYKVNLKLTVPGIMELPISGTVEEI